MSRRGPRTPRKRRLIMIETLGTGPALQPEVDAFSYRVSESGMNYRLYSPSR